MLLWLLQLARTPSASLETILFRASLAALVSFVLALLLGPRLIRWLQRRFREPLQCDSPQLRELHQAKAATPTMGGLFLVAGLIAGIVLFGDLANPFQQAALWVIVGLGLVGIVDDLTKLRGTSNGISARAKLAGQVAVATVAALFLYQHLAALPDGLQLRIPLTPYSWSLGLAFVPWAVLVLVASSNAVNLTDGLDGLAGGCLLSSLAGMMVLAYASEHAAWAAWLNLPHIPGSGEMLVLAGGMIGGVLGFLWFNCHPAQVFMGDTGSLPLGGLLGLLAVVTRQELLLLVIGGVFVVETASVMLQVGYYKWRQRRIFLCAPLHHHFQFQGWPETRVVVRFWIASALCALLGLATLPWNTPDPASAPTAAVSAPSFPDVRLADRSPTSPGKVR